MKGLIIKDLMCLRKQRVTYIYIVIVVLILSIMYVLSARYGNIAVAEQQMIAENNMQDIDVKGLSLVALILFMALPIAMVGDVSSIFMADGRAGFANVSSILPISIEKRVLSKYVTIALFFGIGVATDIVIAFVISRLTDILTFMDFFKIIITIAGALLIYGALICMYMFILGYGKESYAQIFSVMTIIVAFGLANISKVKILLISLFSKDAEVLDINPIMVFTAAVKDHFLSVLVWAIAVGMFSYFLSVVIVKRKRGMV